MSNGSSGSATVESAVNQLEAALGHEVTGYTLNRAEGTVELTLGSRDIEEGARETEATSDVSFGDMDWNELVSLAANEVGYDGEDRDALEAKLREAGVSPEGATNEEPEGFDPEAVRAKLEDGEIEDDDAKGILKENDASPKDWITVFDDCESVEDCDHAANGSKARFCFGCQKAKAVPDPDAFGITEDQAEAVPTLWDDQDHVEDVIAIFE